MEVYMWGTGLESSSYPKYINIDINLSQVSSGDSQYLFLSSSNELFSAERNEEPETRYSPEMLPIKPVVLKDKIVNMSCGWQHSIAISEHGIAYAWGEGTYGALGTGSLFSESSPVQLSLRNIKEVSCGARHSLFLSFNNEVFACGEGKAGQLGTGRRTCEPSPVQIPTNHIIQVECGTFHSGFLDVFGNVFTTGANSFGQLGLGHKTGSSKPVKVPYLESIKKIAFGGHSACISDEGSLYVWGYTTFVPQLFELRQPAKDLSLGASFGVCYDAKGNVYVWGDNNNGELGFGDFIRREEPTLLPSFDGFCITGVSCGKSSCIIVTKFNSRFTSYSPSRGSLEHSEILYQCEKESKEEKYLTPKKTQRNMPRFELTTFKFVE